MNIMIGDRVSDIYGSIGTVSEQFENYWAIIDREGTFLTETPDSWLEEQIIPFTKDQVSNEMWFSVIIDHNGGSILSCESRLTKI